MERIELTYEYGVIRTRRWRSGGANTAFAVQVCVGRLRDGRWFAQRTGYRIASAGGEQAYVFDNRRYGEQLAVRLAYSWMAAGRWEPLPARYSPDGTGVPDDGLPWVLRGNDWVLEPGSESG